MTNQERADLLLWQWQANRDLSPAERMEKLIREAMAPPRVPIEEYEADLNIIRQCIERA